MPVYIAMLRGVNVGGHNRIKMEQLRRSFETLGFEQIRTYIQSGNVVFKATRTSPAALSTKIGEKILSDFGFAVPVVCRTVDELSQTIDSNPFLNQRGIDPEKLHVTFLSDTPASAAVKKIEALTIAPDQSLCLGKEIYLYLPNGVSESSLMKVLLGRGLSVVTTTRNWKTVNALHQLCRDCR
jgi:uncharacterized protein (DUF1697 family)